MELRDYQKELSSKACQVLKEKGLVYLSMTVRTGKTLTSLETCKKYGCNCVLFITKKKAISSILSDYHDLKYDFEIDVINKESLHKLPIKDYDIVIIDEAHTISGYPKPSVYQKEIRKRFRSSVIIFLSGTMSPESYSQIYHQLQVSDNSPFNEFKNFYQWAKIYVNIKKKYLGYAEVNDYSEANFDMIHAKIYPYIITYTQEQAGFKSKVTESVLSVDMKKITYDIIDRLKKDNIYIGRNDTITADSAVKLQQKIHQLAGGTIILDSGSYIILDDTKAKFIKDFFKDKKIAIFYKFKAEYELLKQVIGEHLTNNLDEFNSTNKWIAYQFVSGREGINLSKADNLVMYSIDFSSVSYQQAKDRMTVYDREENHVFWIFANRTLDHMIYKRVLEKKSFTTNIFTKEFLNS